MKLIKRNIVNILFIGALLLIVLVPAAKAFFLKGLMQVGLFDPDVKHAYVENFNLKGIQFKNQAGRIVDLGDLEGKVIFINFWATWCPPCLAEMPSLNKLYSRFHADPDVVFLFVDADADLAGSSGFLKRKEYQWPLYAMHENIPQQVFSGSLPTTIIFDKRGRLSFKHEGIANYSGQKFVDFINTLKELKN